MFQKLMLIGLAGAAGSLSRYGLSGLVQKYMGSGFPFGTFTVNIVGSFLFGFIMAYSENKLTISGEMRIIILVGFMGAFTTFSTFAYESSKLIMDSQYMLAGANILGQNICGILVMLLGMYVGKSL